MAGKDKAAIIIKKEEVVEGGHHGGAWKVAYADFVTAMMAFFLLMWLLNATTEQQRRGLADYFSPKAALSRDTSGFGLPFGGRTPNSDGSLASDRGALQVGRPATPIITMEDDPDQDDEDKAMPRPSAASAEDDGASGHGGTLMQSSQAPQVPGSDQQSHSGSHPNGAGQSRLAFDPTLGRAGNSAIDVQKPRPDSKAAAAVPMSDAEIQAELDRRERKAFEQAAQQLRDAVRDDPSLADLARQLMIEVTPEGLRVQILDEDRTPMFPTGSAVLNERARALLQKVAPVLMRLTQPISIAGHTDSAPYKGGDRSNWDLSADRANATRRLLVESGLPEARLRSVTGMADRDPLIPGDGLAAANRRIAITVLHEPRRPRPARPAAVPSGRTLTADPAGAPVPAPAAAARVQPAAIPAAPAVPGAAAAAPGAAAAAPGAAAAVPGAAAAVPTAAPAVRAPAPAAQAH